jgi:hypothetical protein
VDEEVVVDLDFALRAEVAGGDAVGVERAPGSESAAGAGPAADVRRLVTECGGRVVALLPHVGREGIGRDAGLDQPITRLFDAGLVVQPGRPGPGEVGALQEGLVGRHVVDEVGEAISRGAAGAVGLSRRHDDAGYHGQAGHHGSGDQPPPLPS